MLPVKIGHDDRAILSRNAVFPQPGDSWSARVLLAGKSLVRHHIAMEAIPTLKATLSRAWFGGTIAEFLRMDSEMILGRLAKDSDFAVLTTQRDAWLTQIALLKNNLVGLTGSLFMEFNIPRMGRRVDTVLVIGPVVFVIEF